MGGEVSKEWSWRLDILSILEKIAEGVTVRKAKFITELDLDKELRSIYNSTTSLTRTFGYRDGHNNLPRRASPYRRCTRTPD